MTDTTCEFCRDPSQKYMAAPNGEYMHRAVHGCEVVWNKCRNEAAKPIDPRDPDPSREGIFRNHNCTYCDSGKKPCRQGNPNRCDNPHARND